MKTSWFVAFFLLILCGSLAFFTCGDDDDDADDDDDTTDDDDDDADDDDNDSAGDDDDSGEEIDEDCRDTCDKMLECLSEDFYNEYDSIDHCGVECTVDLSIDDEKTMCAVQCETSGTCDSWMSCMEGCLE